MGNTKVVVWLQTPTLREAKSWYLQIYRCARRPTSISVPINEARAGHTPASTTSIENVRGLVACNTYPIKLVLFPRQVYIFDMVHGNVFWGFYVIMLIFSITRDYYPPIIAFRHVLLLPGTPSPLLCWGGKEQTRCPPYRTTPERPSTTTPWGRLCWQATWLRFKGCGVCMIQSEPISYRRRFRLPGSPTYRWTLVVGNVFVE